MVTSSRRRTRSAIEGIPSPDSSKEVPNCTVVQQRQHRLKWQTPQIIRSLFSCSLDTMTTTAIWYIFSMNCCRPLLQKKVLLFIPFLLSIREIWWFCRHPLLDSQNILTVSPKQQPLAIFTAHKRIIHLGSIDGGDRQGQQRQPFRGIRPEFLREQQQLIPLSYIDNKTPEKEKCVPMSDWQTQVRPSCNSLHELYSETSQLRVLDWGTMSYVASVYNNEGNDDIVLKANLFNKEVSEDYMESRRKDAMVQEHMTHSEFVMPVYGHCASAVVSPLAASGSLFDYITSVRSGGDELLPIDKLKVAVHAAEGLADLHDLESNGGFPSFVHNDLDTTQYVLSNGIFQLNDFNHGKFMHFDATTTGTTKKKLCFERPGMKPYKFRAPEDVAYQSGRDRHPFRIDRADVYALAGVIWVILTNQWYWEGEPRQKSLDKFMDGKRPEIPLQYQRGREHQAMVEAIQNCWIHNPLERPTARQIANRLRKQLKTILGVSKDDDLSLEQLRVALPTFVEAKALDDDGTYF